MVCRCAPGYYGKPPHCRPECLVSSDCRSDQACIRQKCEDPCVGTCGAHATCQMVQHKPVCQCAPGYTGNPFLGCIKIAQPPPPKQPCSPSPCGPNAQCRVVYGDREECSCLPGFVGQPPYCKPECYVDAECAGNRICQQQKCIDPCSNVCGVNADCTTTNHIILCSCIPGYTGDPFTSCQVLPPPVEPIEADPCDPSPCGSNAICSEYHGVATCTCITDYFGDPYVACRPECVSNNECPTDKACNNYHCIDPCVGTCGSGAECKVLRHIASCICPPGYTGNPFTSCRPVQPVENPDPCSKDPCGPNSQQRVSGRSCVCSCEPGYVGSPPNCRPECVVNSDCSTSKACVGQKCRDPCPGVCGSNAICRVTAHNPICSCPTGYTGDPFVHCFVKPIDPPKPVDPCTPNPCGPYSHCKNQNGIAACSCQQGYFGAPPNCRPECVTDSECRNDQACLQQRCRDPCQGACGNNARCSVRLHKPNCVCDSGYQGDPYVGCIYVEPIIEEPTPCNPNPCGNNALCRPNGRAGSCQCVKGYFGDPYESCRPECITNSDCSQDKACVEQKCRNPCRDNTCGINAVCNVINRSPRCSCLVGYEGDPAYECHPPPSGTPVEEELDPCVPDPCGPYSQKGQNRGACSCACLPGYINSPPNCQPECKVNPDCPLNMACIRDHSLSGQGYPPKCGDPCLVTTACGQNAQCRVKQHSPFCTCKAGFEGDPFTGCTKIRLPPPTEPIVEELDPCNPSPCGPYATCRVQNYAAACTCLPEYIGTPPACRPECLVSSDCRSHLACDNQKCVDPCPGACGENADCVAYNHRPVCQCKPNYEGDAFKRCTKRAPRDPCEPNPCGANTEHRSVGNNCVCTCLPNHFGDPTIGCKYECVRHEDCPADKAW